MTEQKEEVKEAQQMSYSCFDEQPDLVLDELDYTETKDGIAVDKFIFDDYQQGTYINIQFADENDDGNVYSYKMINEDDEFIYFEYIG